jgi:hypothetical protein
MYPTDISSELWIELMWRFLWILMIPVAMTLILLTLTAVAEALGRAMDDSQRRNKVSTLR